MKWSTSRKTKRSRVEVMTATGPATRVRKPVQKTYGAKGEYTLGKYERERLERRGQA